MVIARNTAETLDAAGTGAIKTAGTTKADHPSGIGRVSVTESAKAFVTLEAVMNDPTGRIGEMFDVDFLDLLTESRIIQAG